jgi:hypothetical protein
MLRQPAKPPTLSFPRGATHGASSMASCLALLVNISKKHARDKRSSLFHPVGSDEEEKVVGITLTQLGFATITIGKLERYSLSVTFTLVYHLQTRLEPT